MIGKLTVACVTPKIWAVMGCSDVAYVTQYITALTLGHRRTTMKSYTPEYPAQVILIIITSREPS